MSDRGDGLWNNLPVKFLTQPLDQALCNHFAFFPEPGTDGERCGGCGASLTVRNRGFVNQPIRAPLFEVNWDVART